MKRFIFRSLFFLFPVAAVLVAWELYMRSFPHVFKYKRTVVVENCRKNGEIVFLGSSHAYFGVNTEKLPGAYNLSYVSQSLLHDRFIFEQLVSKPHKLKYVAVPVSVFSFFAAEGGLEEWRERDYVRHWDYPERSFTDKFYILDNIPQQLIYVRKYAKRLKRKGIFQTFHISPTGWGTAYEAAGDVKEFEKIGKQAAMRHCNVLLDRTENFAALQAIIKMALQHNIKVILYTPPGHRTYVAHLNAHQEDKMRSMLAELSSGKDVYYLDLLREPEFKDEDFFDPDHMSNKGAEKLALKLYQFYKNK